MIADEFVWAQIYPKAYQLRAREPERANETSSARMFCCGRLLNHFYFVLILTFYRVLNNNKDSLKLRKFQQIKNWSSLLHHYWSVERERKKPFVVAISNHFHSRNFIATFICFSQLFNNKMNNEFICISAIGTIRTYDTFHEISVHFANLLLCKYTCTLRLIQACCKIVVLQPRRRALSACVLSSSTLALKLPSW